MVISQNYQLPRSHPPILFTQTSRIKALILFLLFSPRTSPALWFTASARTLFLTFYCVDLALITSLKVIALWIMDQVPLGHKSPRQGMARLIHCLACRGLLISPLTLSSSHVLLERGNSRLHRQVLRGGQEPKNDPLPLCHREGPVRQQHPPQDAPPEEDNLVRMWLFTWGQEEEM